MSRVKFNKNVAVDYEDCSAQEVVWRTFKQDEVVEATVESHGEGSEFVNLLFENGDIAFDVPKQGLTIL